LGIELNGCEVECETSFMPQKIANHKCDEMNTEKFNMNIQREKVNVQRLIERMKGISEKGKMIQQKKNTQTLNPASLETL
jgi:organic radical activating enzyme